MKPFAKPVIANVAKRYLATCCLSRVIHHVEKQSLTLVSAAFLLAACGDEVTEINANVGAVKNSDDLPACTEDIAGQTAYLKETHEFLGCDGSEWQSLSASTVSVGDNVCMSKSLSDDTGFEIFCNGESIGSVRNGEKGEPGEKGADGKDGEPGAKGDPGDPGKNGTNGTNGTGCEITEATSLTATIACGSETFTMDLTGYVELPAECDATLYEDCTGPVDNVNLSGVSQKGPFVTGTDITAYELENGRSLKQTGKTFGGKIEREDGTFDIKTVKLKSTFAYLVADGFYRNEVTGENSAATIKLRALTNLQGRTNANINLVTHLEYDRVQRLVTKEDSSVLNAKRAAEREIFAAFGIDNSGFKGFAEDYNILEEGDGNAALLAISALLQGNRNESELTALLAALSVDLGDNGKWDNERQRAQVADWAMKKDLDGGLAAIRANIKAWKLRDGEPPAFEGHFRNFWMAELGVDECTADNEGALFATKNSKSAYYAANDSVFTEGDSSLVRLICDASSETPAWRFATDIEKDTAALSAELPRDTAVVGKINTNFVYVKEGDWRRGTELDVALKNSCVADSVGKTDSMTVKHEIAWFVCGVGDEGEAPTAWREANSAEADTALFGVPGDGDPIVRIGNVNKSHVYVYDNGWRYGTVMDLDEGLGPCIEDKVNDVEQLNDAIGTNGWYICVDDENEYAEGSRIPYVWRKASNFERDTHSWPASTNGTLRVSPLSGLYYVFDGSWRPATDAESKSSLGACVWENNGLVHKSGESDQSWYRCTNDVPTTVDGFKIDYTWRVASSSEADTAGFAKITGLQSKMVYKGNLNIPTDNYYVYTGSSWRKATRLEMDTHNRSTHKPWSSSSDGAYQKGTVNDSIYYVYDSQLAKWRQERNELEHDPSLGGCTENRRAETHGVTKGRITLSSGRGIHYYCRDSVWEVASRPRWDTYGKNCISDDVVKGVENTDSVYVCEADSFRVLSVDEIWARNHALPSYRDDIRCGADDEGRRIPLDYVESRFYCENRHYVWGGSSVFVKTDSVKLADGTRYEMRVNGIGTQVWTQFNMPPVDGKGKCIDGMDFKCKGAYASVSSGALYTLAEAKTVCSKIYSHSTTSGDFKLPQKFHLPSVKEWEILLANVGLYERRYYRLDYGATTNTLGSVLKSASLWRENPGSDTYDFSAIPGGYCHTSSGEEDCVKYGVAAWWTSEGEVVSVKEGSHQFGYLGQAYMSRASVRCVADESFDLAPPYNKDPIYTIVF